MVDANYTDGTGKWHSEYIANTKNLPLESLKYIAKDCKNAIDAMPDNPKAMQYWDEIHYCSMEIRRRQNEVKSKNNFMALWNDNTTDTDIT